MNTNEFIKKGVLVKQPTSKQEIFGLLEIVKRDIMDSSSKEVSLDWQFGIAYNAALKLANVLVRGSGFRVKGSGHHMNVIAMIPNILGDKKKNDSDYLDTCRRKRNTVEYDNVGAATESDVSELRDFVLEFQIEVLAWIKKNHSQLL